jgi:hypothetical protein
LSGGQLGGRDKSYFRVLWRRSSAFKFLLWLAALLTVSGIALSFFVSPRNVPSKAGTLGGSTFTSAATASPQPQATAGTQPMPPSQPAPAPPQPAAISVPNASAKEKVVAAVPANPAISVPVGSGETRSLVGKSFSERVVVQDRAIPLPQGRWTVVAHFPSPAQGTVEHVALARTSEKMLGAMVLIQRSTLPLGQSSGFRKSAQCTRQELLYVKVLANEDFETQDCWTINHNISANWAGQGAQGILRAAFGELKVRGIEAPPVLLSVFYRIADKATQLHAVYYFNPQVEGISPSQSLVWDESDWHRAYIYQYPDKARYVSRLIAWSEGWHPRLRQEFGGSPPMVKQSPAQATTR